MPADPADFVPEDVPGAQPAQAGPMAEQPGAQSAGRADWSSSARAVPIALLCGGIWLVASIAPFTYEVEANPVLAGLTILLAAILALVAGRSRAVGIVICVVALWLIASPFLLDEARPETTNLVVLGGCGLVLALVWMAAGEEGRRRSRG